MEPERPKRQEAAELVAVATVANVAFHHPQTEQQIPVVAAAVLAPRDQVMAVPAVPV